MEGPLSRRDFVKGAVLAASAGALAIGALGTFLPVLSGDRLDTPAPIARRVQGALVPVTVRDLDGPAVATVTGEWMHQAAVVYKVRKETLMASSEKRGYNTGQFALQHPNEEDLAILAYDGRCTHMGCTVGFNPTLGAARDVVSYDGDLVADGRVLCPCHQAQFDVFDLGHHLPNTPAPRPLDVLAIRWGAERDGSPTIEAVRRHHQDMYRAADQQGDGAPFRLAA